MNANTTKFIEVLAEEYHDLFKNDPDYSYSASKNTPEELAKNMTIALKQGRANKNGEGILRTCKKLKIPYTYLGIREFLETEDTEE